MVARGKQHLRIVGTTIGEHVAGRSLERFHFSKVPPAEIAGARCYIRLAKTCKMESAD
jgi:hypothetical protein